MANSVRVARLLLQSPVSGRGLLWRAYSQDESRDASHSKVRLYTRTGDKGVSSTFAGQRLPKDDDVFESLGATDELSSVIGLAREYCLEKQHHDITEQLQEIQCVLQDVGSHVATPRTQATKTKLSRTSFKEKHVETLEQWIDIMDDQLPQLQNFILPSGGKCSATLHMARAICRRAERRIVPLYRTGQVEQAVAKYLNRLSDFLFTAARYAAQKEKKNEVIYHRVD